MREQVLKSLGYVILKDYVLKSSIHSSKNGKILRRASLVVKIKTPVPDLGVGGGG